MRGFATTLLVLLVLGVSCARADDGPFKLDAGDNQSVYAEPSPPTENDFVNSGGVNIDLKTTYFSKYVYRGIDQNKGITGANLQFDGVVSLNLGKAPHPFVGVFVNVFNNDPVSRFQEIRPYIGVEWTLRPLIIQLGNTSYIYPSREREFDTSEVFAKITLMDEVLLRREAPLLSPYAFAAYDYSKYDGWYFEAGVSHSFAFEHTGFVLTAQADVAYVGSFSLYAGPTGKDTGFQRYDLGLIGKYSLNKLLNIPQRYGDWSINGYLYYTDGLSNTLDAETHLWGGAGIEFHY